MRPFSLTLVSILFFAISVAAQPKNLARQLDEFLVQASEFGFSGSVIVAVDDKIVLHKGYELADRGRGVLLKPNDVFDIGSLPNNLLLPRS